MMVTSEGPPPGTRGTHLYPVDSLPCGLPRSPTVTSWTTQRSPGAPARSLKLYVANVHGENNNAWTSTCLAPKETSLLVPFFHKVCELVHSTISIINLFWPSSSSPHLLADNPFNPAGNHSRQVLSIFTLLRAELVFGCENTQLLRGRIRIQPPQPQLALFQHRYRLPQLCLLPYKQVQMYPWCPQCRLRHRQPSQINLPCLPVPCQDSFRRRHLSRAPAQKEAIVTQQRSRRVQGTASQPRTFCSKESSLKSTFAKRRNTGHMTSGKVAHFWHPAPFSVLPA